MSKIKKDLYYHPHPWIICDQYGYRCCNCGAKLAYLSDPVPFEILKGIMDGFQAAHKDCTEPVKVN